MKKFPARASAQNAEAPGANQENEGICKFHKFIHAYKPFQKTQKIVDDTASNVFHVQDVSAPPGTLCWSFGEVFQVEEPWRGNGPMGNQL